MKSLKGLIAGAMLTGAVLVAAPVFAAAPIGGPVTLAESQSANDFIDGPSAFLIGQSFTVGGTGTFNNIAANFYGTAGNAFAPGTLYLYSSAYTGTAGLLGTPNSKLLGSAVGSNGGSYVFNSALTLTGGTQYFAYSDAGGSKVRISDTNPYGLGVFFVASNGNESFRTIESVDARFKVTSAPAVAAAVPEPATWALMLVGFGMIGSAVRRRSSVKTTVRYA